MAHRKDSATQSRLDARAEQIRKQAAAEKRNRNIVIAVFTVVILGGGGGLFYLLAQSTAPSIDVGAQAIADEGRTHVPAGTPLSPRHQPPSSGSHYPSPTAWAASARPVPAGSFIHNLEHGGVVLVYRCQPSTCGDLYNQASAIYSSLPQESTFNEVKFVSTEYEAMKPAFAVLAWDHELDMSTLDPAKVKAFYQQFVDRGPENIA